MPGTTTQFKLGLFSLAALVAFVIAAVALGVRATRPSTERFQTYFDESTQGLEIGSPVKYRGVRIGNVSDISIAPDRKQVNVGLAIERGAARRLDLARNPPGLRTELVMQGITGVKFIDMDFVDPEVVKPPILGFPPGKNYIPSQPSLFKGLEGRVGGVLDQLPDLIDSATLTFNEFGVLLDEMHRHKLGDKASKVLANLEHTSEALDHWVAQIDRARLPAHLTSTLNKLDALATKLTSTADQLSGTSELIASATRATDSIGEVGRSARGAARELDRTLRELGEAARAFRDLVDELQREPDMLVKGKARTR